MTRFWITLKGGEMFVSKIPSMNIMDLAADGGDYVDLTYVNRETQQRFSEFFVERGIIAADCDDTFARRGAAVGATTKSARKLIS